MSADIFIKEAFAALAGVSVDTVIAWIKRGTVPLAPEHLQETVRLGPRQSFLSIFQQEK